MVIYAKDGIEDRTGFVPYRKKRYSCGYIPTDEIFNDGSEIIISTLEGTVNVKCSHDYVIMIGLCGEIYPEERKLFEDRYLGTDEAYEYGFQDVPKTVRADNGKACDIFKYAKKCICNSRTKVYVKQLEEPVSIHTRWNYESCMNGKAGDYLCISGSDENDIYIIDKDILPVTYERCTDEEI